MPSSTAAGLSGGNVFFLSSGCFFPAPLPRLTSLDEARESEGALSASAELDEMTSETSRRLILYLFRLQGSLRGSPSSQEMVCHDKDRRSDSYLSLRDVSRAMISYHFSLSFLSGRSLPLFFSLTRKALAQNKPVAIPARWLAWSMFLNGVKTPKVSRMMINDNKT